MAEYKALAQNTYKFITETTLLHTGDIGHSLAPQIGRAKMISNTGEVLYAAGSPYKMDTEAVETNLKNLNYSNGTSASSFSLFSTIGYDLYGKPMNARCFVENKWYYGLKNAQFLFYMNFGYNSRGNTLTMEGGHIFPACTVKIVKYVAAGGSISIVEKKFNTVDVAKIEKSGVSGNTTVLPYGYQLVLLTVEKTTDDIILAISIEYDSYDITLSGEGSVQYSIDDGATYQPLTDGTVLNSVEHVFFKNTSSATTYHIGTTQGGSNIAKIDAGAFAYIPTTANATWYISTGSASGDSND